MPGEEITIINKRRTLKINSNSCLGRPSDKPGTSIKVTHENPFVSMFVSLTVRESMQLATALIDSAKASLEQFRAFKEE